MLKFALIVGAVVVGLWVAWKLFAAFADAVSRPSDEDSEGASSAKMLASPRS